MDFVSIPDDPTGAWWLGWVTPQYTRVSWKLSQLHTCLLPVYCTEQRSVQMSALG